MVGHPSAGDLVQVAATQILQVAGMAAYHTSVIIGTKEYYFDTDGIASAPALWSHFSGADDDLNAESNTEVFAVGYTHLSGSAFCQGLEGFFPGGSYDVLLKNCNAFTDAACYFLTRQRLHGKYSRLERLFAGTRPLSTKLLAAMMRGVTGGDVDPSGLPQDYLPNPLAENFSVEDVVARCNSLDAASRAGRFSQQPGASGGFISAAAAARGVKASRGNPGREPVQHACIPCTPVCDPLACLMSGSVNGVASIAPMPIVVGDDSPKGRSPDGASEAVILFEALPMFPSTPSPLAGGHHGASAFGASAFGASSLSPFPEGVGVEWRVPSPVRTGRVQGTPGGLGMPTPHQEASSTSKGLGTGRRIVFL